MIEYTSKPMIIKVDDDHYELIDNVHSLIISTLTKADMEVMIKMLTEMLQSNCDRYYFPPMKHTVTG